MFHRRAAALILLAAVVLAAATASAQESPRTVRVGLFPMPPLLFRDAEENPAGLYADLLERIAEREHWRIEYVDGTWAEGLERVRNQDIDLMPVTIPTPERDRRLDFCRENVMMVWGQVYIAADSPIQNILDLDGRRVALARDDLNGENFLAKAQQFNIVCVVEQMGSHHEIFRRVADGEVAAGVAPNVFGYEYAGEYGIVPSPILFDPRETTFAAPEGAHPDLLEAIDRLLVAWKNDPESPYFAALNRWVGQRRDTDGPLPRLIVYTLVAAAVLTILLLLWNRVLDARVRARTRELQASEAKIRIIFDQTYQFLGLLDTEGRLQEVNETAARFLGAEPEDFIGLSFWDCPWWNHDPEIQEEVKQAIRKALTGATHFGETIHLDGAGLPHTIQYTIKPTLDADGQVDQLIAEGHDITDKHQLEDELRRSQRLEAIGTLAGGIAHDFNNILTAIIGFNEMALEEAAGHPRIENSLREVERAAARARDLVQQILTFGRRRQPEKSNFAPGRIVQEALRLLRSSLPSTIDIESDLANSCWLIAADPTQFHQIVMNLGTNAYHAMAAEGGVLRIRLRDMEFSEREPVIGARMPAGRYVVLEVSDTGVGMDEAVREKVFEPYFTCRAQGEGTGLGLSVVHGIVESSNGFIHVQSEPGVGTAFRVFFPACELPAEQPDEDEGPATLRGSERILFIDDEKSLTQLVSRYLETLGYRVATFSDSEQAWDHIRENADAIDLIVTDQTMPRLTGVDLVRRLRDLPAAVPVILCTGYNAGDDRELEDRLGIRRVLHKPMMMKELAARIREVLDEPPPRRP